MQNQDQMQKLIAGVIWSLTISIIPLALPIARNLEYEYLWLVGLFAALGTPWFNLLLPKKYSIMCLRPLHLFVIFPFIICLPGSIAYALQLCRCSPQSFYFWFGIQTYPAWVIGLGLSQITQFMISYQFRKFPSYLLLTTLQLSSLVGGVALMWLTPQKRMTHLLLGYLHGPIYDSWLPMDEGIVLSRFAQGCFGIALYFIFKKPSFSPRNRLFLIGFSSLLLLPQWFQPSTSHGAWILNRLLPKTMEHPHFTLHYANTENSPSYEKQIEELYWEARFHVNELRSQLGLSVPIVHIYVYPDEDSKKLWFGGGGTDVTDVVTPSIHILPVQGSHPTLRHELVHALGSSFAFHGLGFHPNMALTEGLAVALAPSWQTRGLDEATAAMIHHGRLPAFEELLSPLFWIESGARAYTAAGSLIKYLIDQYGMTAVTDLYAHRSERVQKKEVWFEVIKQWKQDLTTRYPKKRDLEAESLYRYPGLFFDSCPHTKALLRKREKDFWTRIRQPINWDVGKHYWNWRMELDSTDNNAKVEILRQRAVEIFETKQTDLVADLIQEIRQSSKLPLKYLEDIEVQIIQSDLQRWAEKSEKNQFDSLLEIAREPLIGPALTRQIWARSLIETSSLNDQEKLSWRFYLAGWEPIPIPPKLTLKSPWIVHYLLNFRWRGLPPEELIHLDPAQLQAAVPMTFYEIWFLNLGFRFYEASQWQMAMTAFKKALVFSHPGSQEKISELIRQMHYYQAIR